MARRSAAQVARRAELRSMLKGATMTQINKLYNAGKVSTADLRTFYSDVRSDYNRQISRIEKSDVGFVERPQDLPTTRAVKTPEALIKGIAEANRFIGNKGMSTVGGRRKIRDKSIETLHSRGITVVNKENYNLWVRFQKWYENQAKKYGYGSDAAEIVDLFEEADSQGLDNSSEWEDLLENFMLDGVY